jgi:electron transfer flavoprotein beta subunit
MNIIVCIKQVPETAEIRIDEKTNTLVREGVPAIINPFDTYALEEGIRIREKCGGKVTALTMGPSQAEQALREAMAMGVDSGVLLSDRVCAGSDTLATSYTLSRAIRQMGRFDLVICGKQATDGDTAQVGSGIAEMLGIPFIAYVRKIEEIREGYIRAERLMETGFQVIEMSLPSLITVVKEINEPRLPSLRGMLKAKKADIPVWNVEKLGGDTGRFGLDGSPTQVIRIFTPEPRKGGEIFQGTVEEQVTALMERLKETKLV